MIKILGAQKGDMCLLLTFNVGGNPPN